MRKPTVTVNLLSKVSKTGDYHTADVTYMDGKVQEIASDMTLDSRERLIQVLARVVVRVGDNLAPNETFLRKMLSGDLRKMAVASHIYSRLVEDKDIFKFSIPYTDARGSLDMASGEIDLWHNSKVTLKNEDGEPILDSEGKETFEEVKTEGFREDPYGIFFDSYLQFSDDNDARHVNLTLPFSKTEVRWSIPNFNQESDFAKTKGIKKITIGLKYRLRNLVYKQETTSGFTWVTLDIKDLHAQDIKCINDSIKNKEGDVYSTITVTLPVDAQEENKVFPMDVLHVSDFFFLGV
jgi:hypothetical protein